MSEDLAREKRASVRGRMASERPYVLRVLPTITPTPRDEGEP